MLARLTSGIALASIAALALVGCTPPEPTLDDVRTEIEATFDGFQHAIDSEVATGSIAADALEPYATPELSQAWAADVQGLLDSGYVSQGVPTLTNIEVVDQTADSIDARLCTDGSGIETTDAGGSTIAPAGLTAWDATFVRDSSDGALLMAGFDPIADETVCAS